MSKVRIVKIDAGLGVLNRQYGLRNNLKVTLFVVRHPSVGSILGEFPIFCSGVYYLKLNLEKVHFFVYSDVKHMLHLLQIHYQG